MWALGGHNKLGLRRKPKNLHAKSQHSGSYSFQDLRVHTVYKVYSYLWPLPKQQIVF